MQGLFEGIPPREVCQGEKIFANNLAGMEHACDIICSAPLAAILSGEHAGIDGSYMLVLQIPIRVYVGFIGRNDSQSVSAEPVISNFTYYDPVRHEVYNMSNHPEYIGVTENLRNIGPLLKSIAKEHKYRWLPGEVVVLSEAPPGRGTNWSGAFASALALALYLLQGNRQLPVQLDPQYWNPSVITKRDDDIDHLFRIALTIECKSHGLSSGYGPACSLLPGLGQVLVFKGYIGNANKKEIYGNERNHGFFFAHWDAYKKSIKGNWNNIGDIYDIIIADSGFQKSTHDRIQHLRNASEGAISHDFASLLNSDPNAPNNYLDLSKQWPDRLLYDQRVGTALLGGLSLLTIKTLRDCCAGLESDAASVVRTIQSIDQIHCQLELSFPALDKLRKELRPLIGRYMIAVKISGGGGGGCIVLFGKKIGIEQIPIIINGTAGINLMPYEHLEEPSPTIIWQLSRDGIENRGAQLYYSRHQIPFSARRGNPPYTREPRLHKAVILNAHGEHTREQPASVFNIYLALRRYALQGTSVYFYFHGESASDGQEPIYFTHVAKNVPLLHADIFKPKEGFPAIKSILTGLIRTGGLSVVNPISNNGGFKLTETEINEARNSFNAFSNILRDKYGFDFPRLSVTKRSILPNVYELVVKLVMPMDAHLFVVYMDDVLL